MMQKQFFLNFSLLLMLLSLGCSKRELKQADRTIGADHIVDLTHTLTDKFPFIPVKKLTYPFELVRMATIKENGVEANSWKIHEHLGTHTDAPNHFVDGQRSLDQIPLSELIVPVVVIDISFRALMDRDAELTVSDLLSFEKRYGRIPANACVMMYSGWEKYLNDPRFVGLEQDQRKHYPGFSTAAIDFLVNQRNISGIGVDVLSIDPGKDEAYIGHKILFSAGKWAVECVANLEKIPKSGATVIVAAPKVGKATGGFSRIIALW